MAYSNTLIFVTPPGEDFGQTSAGPSNEWRRSHNVDKRRRTTFTRYVKSWTAEEEAFLLRQRHHKMPYKHIAIHLQKTELACRLHYHQMTSTKHRGDITASDSLCSQGLNSTDFPENDVTIVDPDPSLIYAPIPSSPNNAHSAVKISPVVLESPPIPDRFMTPNLYTPTEQVINTENSPMKEEVDLGRLHHVYEDHREDIWAFIAEKYSAKSRVSPSDLETAFFSARAVSPGLGHNSSDSRLSSPSFTQQPNAAEPGSHLSIDNSISVTHSSRLDRCTVRALLNTTDELARMERDVNCF